MLKIVKNDIYLTRGDTAVLNLSIKNQDGTKYEVLPEDQILLTIKKSVNTDVVLVQKAAINNLIYINAIETDNLAYGTYYYDVELRRPDGFVATVIPPHVFKLTGEVTY